MTRSIDALVAQFVRRDFWNRHTLVLQSVDHRMAGITMDKKAISIEELIRLYTAHLLESRQGTTATASSNLRRFFRHVDRSISADEFASQLVVHQSAFLRAEPTIPASSLKAINSVVLDMLRWAYTNGALTIGPDAAMRLGMPLPREFGREPGLYRGRAVYRRMLLEMHSKGVDREHLDDAFMESFLQTMIREQRITTRDWREFIRGWRSLARKERLPDLRISSFPTKRPSRYYLSEDEMPASLIAELREVEARLLRREYRGRKPIALPENSTQVSMEILRRFLGFLVNQRRQDPKDLALSTALTTDKVLLYINFTNKRGRPRHHESDHVGFGKYELSILNHLAMVAHVGLQDDKLHRELVEESRRKAGSSSARREPYKDPFNIDRYYEVSCRLIERAASNGSLNKLSHDQAMLIRDALIIALLAAHGYQPSTLAGLRMDELADDTAHGSVLINIPRNRNVPGARDLKLHLPVELRGLLRLYINRARPCILGDRTDHGFLLVAQGGKPISPRTLASAVVRHCRQILGKHQDPNLIRKALIRDYTGWTNGDFLTISAVLDLAPIQTELRYKKVAKAKKTSQIDERMADELQGSSSGRRRS